MNDQLPYFQPGTGTVYPTANSHKSVLSLVPLIVVTVLFVMALGFAIWAAAGRADYKNNSDKKSAAAAEVAKKEEASKKDNEFAEKEKSPTKNYSGPKAYGSVVLSYPKSWSAYVIEGQGSLPVDGYFHPDFVPGTSNSQASYALRLQITSASYDQELTQYDSNVKSGQLKATPITLPRVSSVTGVRLDGAISSQKQGSLVLIPLRDKTLKVWTESSQFTNDFNTYVLPNLTFSP